MMPNKKGIIKKKWKLELIAESENWGRSIHINPDKWLLYFAWGDFELDFIWISDS
jgi:hypothetical protein